MIKFRPTLEQQEFIKNNVKGLSNTDLTNLFNKTFSTDFKETQIKTYKTRNNLKSGIDTRFKKGHCPAIKGKPIFYGGLSTRFQKGHKGYSYKELGSERINANGYWEVKVHDPDVWELKHRLVWQEKYGEIPAGHRIIFADKDKNNLNIDNLILVSPQQLLILNRNRLIKEDSGLTKTGVIIATMLDRVNYIKKNNKKSG